jgi:DNA polymerase
LAAAAGQCTACPELVGNRSTVVVGDAPWGSRLVLVGEAPGAEEDRTGRPFVGRSGRLLDELLAEAGLDRAQVAFLNVVKCRPPANRPPRSSEVANCSGWLDRQLDLLQGDVICTLGLSAMQRFLGRRLSLAAARGTVHQVAGARLVSTYHPSAALRFGPRGAPRAALREDLQSIAALLSQPC